MSVISLDDPDGALIVVPIPIYPTMRSSVRLIVRTLNPINPAMDKTKPNDQQLHRQDATYPTPPFPLTQVKTWETPQNASTHPDMKPQMSLDSLEPETDLRIRVVRHPRLLIVQLDELETLVLRRLERVLGRQDGITLWVGSGDLVRR